MLDATAVSAGRSLTATCRFRENSEIGFNLEQDQARGYHVTDSGIVVVPREAATREFGEELAFAVE